MQAKIKIRGGHHVLVWPDTGCRTATATEVEMFALISSIQGALGTEETGEALVEVARNAHQAEQDLASMENDHTDWGDPDDGLRGTGERGA